MTAVSLVRDAPSEPPTSQQSAAIVRSVYEAFSGLAQGGDIGSYVRAHFDTDCEYSPVEEASTIRGHDALTRWIERWLDAAMRFSNASTGAF